MKLKSQIGILILLTGIFTVCLFAVQQGIRQRRKVKFHTIAYQRNDLTSIAFEFQYFVLENGPYHTLEEALEYLQNEDEVTPLISRGYDPERNILLDRWGTAIQLKAVSPRDHHLISAGPNRKYEEGRGDDIDVQFDPMEELEKHNKLIQQYQER